MQGATDPALPHDWAVLARNVKGAVARESYLPAGLSISGEGILTAIPLKWGGSSDFVGFVRATSLIIVPRDTGVIEAGMRVKLVRLPV